MARVAARSLNGATRTVLLDGARDARGRRLRRAVAPPPGAAGGLTLRLQASEGRRLLGSLFGIGATDDGANVILDRFGDLTGWASAATDGVRGQLQLGLR